MDISKSKAIDIIAFFKILLVVWWLCFFENSRSAKTYAETDVEDCSMEN